MQVDDKANIGEKALDYIIKVGNRISEEKWNIIKDTKQTYDSDVSIMLTHPPGGELLKMLVKLSGAKKGIEIGVFTGYSALCLAEGIGKDGKLYCFDICKEYTDMAEKHWKINGVRDRIELIIGNAVDSLKQLEDQAGTFDFVYIDADKVNYINYYELVLPLLKSNGFIVFDNTLWQCRVCDESIDDPTTTALRNLNKFLRDDSRVEINMLNIGDGVTIVRKI
jgi:predicted O-methyltransferase YrrM